MAASDAIHVQMKTKCRANRWERDGSTMGKIVFVRLCLEGKLILKSSAKDDYAFVVESEPTVKSKQSYARGPRPKAQAPSPKPNLPRLFPIFLFT